MSVIVHPQYVKLKKELSDLIFEYEELVNHVCPSIDQEYIINFGFLEHTLYKKESELDILKMKLRLIQKEINHQNEVDMNKIDEVVLDKYKEHEKKLKLAMDDLNKKMKAKENSVVLSEEDAKNVKKTYKKLVKKLHPDLNSNQSDFEKNLFIKSTFAFKNGDLDELNSILLILPSADLDEEGDIEKMERLIGEYKIKIEDVKSEYPYNKRDFLYNIEKRNEYINSLNMLIESCTEEIGIVQEKIDELI